MVNMNLELLKVGGENVMQCDECKVTFVEKNKFLDHLSKKACFYKLTKDGKFLCEKCSKSYVYKSDLNRHMKNKHSAL